METQNKVQKTDGAQLSNTIFNGLQVNCRILQGEKVVIFNSIFEVNVNGSLKFVRKAIMAQMAAIMKLNGKQVGIAKNKKFDVIVTVGKTQLLTGTYFHNSNEKVDIRFWQNIASMLNVSLPEIMK